MLEKDNELVRVFVKDRSEKSFKRLFSQCNPGLLRIANTFLNGQTHFVEDVVQDAWLTAIRNIEEFRGESMFKTWLVSILINKCREKTREVKKHSHSELDDNHAVAKEQSVQPMDLDKAVSSLPGSAREILCLHDIEGFKHEEIAELLGISVGTSKSQLFHARRRLRIYLNAG